MLDWIHYNAFLFDSILSDNFYSYLLDMKVSKTKRGYIITWDEEEHIKKGNFEIRAVPLYKFLLERFL